MELNYIFTNFLATDTLNLNLSNLELYANELKDSSDGRIVSNKKGWQSNDLNHDDFELKELISEIKERIFVLLESQEFETNFFLDNIWMNINSTHAYNEIHIHPNSLLSGVFYVKVPKNSGRIVFVNPNFSISSFLWKTSIKKLNGFNSQKWKIDPKENMLLIFPSWLHHYVEPNDSNENRISISFNIGILRS